MKIIAPTSDEVKVVIMGMKNTEAAGTDHLWLESFKYSVYKLKNCGKCDKSVKGRRKDLKLEDRIMSVV
jgi:hypothetical protein